MAGRAQPRWSLGALFTVTLTIFGIIAFGTSIALTWSTTLLHESMTIVARDLRSMALSDEIGFELLTHARLSFALDARPNAAQEQARDEIEDTLPALVDRARELAATDDEQALLEIVDRELEIYLETSDHLTERAKTGASVRGVRRASMERAVAAIDALRSHDERQVTAVLRGAEAVDRIATGVALGAILTILIGLAIVAFTLRRSVLRPIGDLRLAIDRYRTGEHHAPIQTHGPAEIAELARAFEEMRLAVARQREDRLTFLASVAHDLRNPLSPLKQGVVLLAHDRSIAENSSAQRTLALLGRQIDRLNRMISDLLDSTRIEAGQLELDLAELDVREPVRDTVELYAIASSEHEVRLSMPDQPLPVRADALRIEQVVSNLLSNAIKYSPRGGPVHVEVSVDGDDAVIAVHDRGIGIAPEDLGNVFAPFRRREAAREVAPGAGLGLSVVRRILEAHGGTIAVESTIGEGSTFRARLPRSHDADAPTPA
ncbi:MAG: HAMP domain-containing histidine kinase [Myxococcota bacterium]|nr:HAMP domain-containing histidine kinase [Myxococcota bacterium]